MNFSVLISIYKEEKPDNFDLAMKSIWTDQILRPREIVLVEDGILNQKLYEVISKWKKTLQDCLKIIKLEKNSGLGIALNVGLDYCSYAIVARMDTDDISMPERFFKQVAIFHDKKIDVCGSWVSEFNNQDDFITFRKTPEEHEQIYLYAKTRNPINHPSVMFRKNSVERAGGFKEFLFFEDYYLWVRMIINGSRFYNIQEPLVSMRSGNDQYKRRRGLKYFLSEYRLFHRFLNLGFIDYFHFFKITPIRLIVRIMPNFIVSLIYKLIRRKI